MRALLGFCLADEASGSGMALCDEGVSLFDALADMLLVELAGKLQQVVGAAGIDGILLGRHRVGRRSSDRRGQHRRGCDKRRSAVLRLADITEPGLLRCIWERRRLCCASLQFVDSGLTRNQPLPQFLVFLIETPQLDDNLVQEVIDLILVVALAKLGRLEPLVDYVFRRKGHGCHLKKLSGSARITVS